MATIQEEMSGNVAGEQGSPTGNSDLLKVLRRENEHLQSEVAWLRSRVDQLTLLMLPKPKGLFAWLRPRWSVKGKPVECTSGLLSRFGSPLPRLRRLTALSLQLAYLFSLPYLGSLFLTSAT